jgi:hypothetical protein
MKLLLAQWPKDRESLVPALLDEARRTPIWKSFNVRLDCEQLPSSIVGQSEAAAAEHRRSTLLAIQEFEHPVPDGSRITQNPCRVEQTAGRSAVWRRAAAHWSRTCPEALYVLEEPMDSELTQLGRTGAVARGPRNQQPSDCIETSSFVLFSAKQAGGEM